MEEKLKNILEVEEDETETLSPTKKIEDEAGIYSLRLTAKILRWISIGLLALAILSFIIALADSYASGAPLVALIAFILALLVGSSCPIYKALATIAEAADLYIKTQKTKLKNNDGE